MAGVDRSTGDSPLPRLRRHADAAHRPSLGCAAGRRDPGASRTTLSVAGHPGRDRQRAAPRRSRAVAGRPAGDAVGRTRRHLARAGWDVDRRRVRRTVAAGGATAAGSILRGRARIVHRSQGVWRGLAPPSRNGCARRRPSRSVRPRAAGRGGPTWSRGDARRWCHRGPDGGCPQGARHRRWRAGHRCDGGDRQRSDGRGHVPSLASVGDEHRRRDGAEWRQISRG